MLLALAPVAALPWLQGFFAPAASSSIGSADCGREDASAMTIVADVVPATPGAEQIRASYSGGIRVIDRDHRELGRIAGLRCESNADALVAIAAGSVDDGVPLIAIAATSSTTTTLRLYRVGESGGLEPVFAAPVEDRVPDAGRARPTTRTGVVTLVPGGLVYRAPAGTVSLWTYDHDARRYIESHATRPSA
jgi:hypothetical protein